MNHSKTRLYENALPSPLLFMAAAIAQWQTDTGVFLEVICFFEPFMIQWDMMCNTNLKAN